MAFDILINSLVTGEFKWDVRLVIFKLHSVIGGSGIFLSQMNIIGLDWWYVKIGSSNRLVPPGNKSQSEPMLTEFITAT